MWSPLQLAGLDINFESHLSVRSYESGLVRLCVSMFSHYVTFGVFETSLINRFFGVYICALCDFLKSSKERSHKLTDIFSPMSMPCPCPVRVKLSRLFPFVQIARILLSEFAECVPIDTVPVCSVFRVGTGFSHMRDRDFLSFRAFQVATILSD